MPTGSWRTARCWCIAHRGGSDEAPENTLVAFRHAVALGADMVECDARLSRDGVAVVCHDARLDRTTAATGPVGAYDVAALAAVGVPTLADALAACAPLPVTLELKEGAGLVEAAAAAIRDSGRPEQVIVGSFVDARLAAWRERMPGCPTSMAETEASALVGAALTGGVLPPVPPGAVALQVPLRHGGVTVVSEPVVTAAHELDLAVHVWTVDGPDTQRWLIGLGVDGIMADQPSRLRRLLDAG